MEGWAGWPSSDHQAAAGEASRSLSGVEKDQADHQRQGSGGSEHLRASGVAASSEVVVGRGVESEMALLVVREVAGWGRCVSGVGTEDVGGWAPDLRRQCVHHSDGVAAASGGACSAVEKEDGSETAGGTSRGA